MWHWLMVKLCLQHKLTNLSIIFDTKYLANKQQTNEIWISFVIIQYVLNPMIFRYTQEG